MVRMKPRARCVPAWLVAVLVLAGAGWFSAPDARAGCSHYVAAGVEATRSGATDLDPLITAGASSEGSWRISPLDRSPARPCSGFGCSRDSRPPMTSSLGLSRIDTWARFEFPASVLRDHSSLLTPDSDSPHPLDRADRLARPPRP
jgi:hypothetical protein